MVKPELAEPQEKSRVTKNPRFPAVQNHARRSIPETATPQKHISDQDVEISQRWAGLANALCGERPAMSRLKETNGAPTRTTRLLCVKAGSPTSREAQGDGVPIVLKW